MQGQKLSIQHGLYLLFLFPGLNFFQSEVHFERFMSVFLWICPCLQEVWSLSYLGRLLFFLCVFLKSICDVQSGSNPIPLSFFFFLYLKVCDLYSDSLLFFGVSHSVFLSSVSFCNVLFSVSHSVFRRCFSL